MHDTMKVLVTGKGGNAGSWHIRGLQLGAAMGATVKPLATLEDCAAHDVVVVVKRTAPALIDTIRQSGKPWVMDLVDGWPQPCHWSGPQAVAWLRQRLADIKPTGVIYGTDRMREDAGIDGLVLPHHSWSRYVDHTPMIRDQVQVVGYEGVPEYLGGWRLVLEVACKARGWRLAINEDMRQSDIGIALRDGGGYPARWWKPGTKLSNLHALGIPALCSMERGYLSVASGAEYWVQTSHDVHAAFDQLESVSLRTSLSAVMRAARIDVNTIAGRYRQWLVSLI